MGVQKATEKFSQRPDGLIGLLPLANGIPTLLTPTTSLTRSTLFFLFSLALLLQFRSYIPLFRDGLGEDAEVKKAEHISTETNTVIPRFRHLKSGHTTHH